METFTTSYKGISYTVDMTTIRTLTIGCYKVDIITTNGMHEAWMYHKKMGYKMHMYAVLASDVNSLDFERMVVESLPRYEKDYIRNLYKLQGDI